MRTLATAALAAVLLPLIARAPAAAACPETDLGSAPSVTVTGTTAGAANNYVGTCGGGGASAPERTFAYAAPATDVHRIDTFGSSFDTILYVRDATCTGAEIGCNDDHAMATLQSEVVLTLLAG